MILDEDVHRVVSAIQSIQKSISCFKTEEEQNHQYRTQIEPILFQGLMRNYMNQFDSYWNETTIPRESSRAIVIVERRCHPNLEFCIKNAVYFARGFSLYIFCSHANREFVETICGSQKEYVNIIPIFDTIGSSQEGKEVYNQLLCDEQFWKMIQADVCLTMETDSYLRAPLPESIFEYDYVASKWPWLSELPGGGGISMRKRTMMIHICQDQTLCRRVMQDSFVSEGVEKGNYTYPSWEQSRIFFVECLSAKHGFCPDVCGVHQWWTFLNQFDGPTLAMIVKTYMTLFV